MFISQFIITIIFRLLNFIIVICLAGYLFKRYGLPVVYSLMAKQESDKENLLIECAFLDKKQADLDNVIKMDVIRCDALKNKIDEWRRVAEDRKRLHEKNRLERIVTIKKNIAKKREIREQAVFQKAVAAGVFAQLDKSLRDHFAQDDAGARYLESMVDVINERVS